MKTYFIEDAHGPHYEWLMEKTKNLVEYAKREDYKKVAAFCENILEGLRNNKLVDSKLKDGLRKKINNESITLPGDWNKAGADAAKRMGLTFTLTGRYALGLPVAKISGDRQTLIKYVKKWYDPDFFEDGYDLFDSKVVDSKLKDVRLEKGDWFTLRNSRYLYKVVNVSQEYLVCEIYYMYYDYNKKLSLRNEGRKPRRIDNKELKLNTVRFNSAGEALDWAYRQAKIRNTNKTWK